jgi:hypothetical protein
MCVKMNKHQSSTKILIMRHYVIWGKQTFDLHRNIKLHIVNMNYYKIEGYNFLEIYVEIIVLIFICTIVFLHHI